MTMEKLVIIKIGEGSFDQGFPVNLQISENGDRVHTSLDGKLPHQHQLPELSEQWRLEYNEFSNLRQINLPSLKDRKAGKRQKISRQDFIDGVNRVAPQLTEALNNWLNSDIFRPIKEKFLEKIKTDDMVRVIIQTEDPLLRRLPWYLWDLFASYRLAEVALFSSAFERVEKLVQHKHKVRILAILGDKTGIDIDTDRKFLENLSNAETVFLVEPNRQEFNEKLWDDKGWDILFFAGHSSSKPDGTTGKMYINYKENLTIPDLKYALQKAIERGLQLAIFNSCDGLGIARDLTELQIPQIIVMREPVPDLVAKEFLKYFLSSFSNGNSLYLAVREAREHLHGLEKDFPCASWLPLICQNPAENPVTWQGLRGIEAGINWQETCQNALAERQKLTTNPLTTGDGVELTFDDIYVPLGLVEKVKKEKRPGEVSPEEGSQFYQPEKEYEEVTRSYKNDEFFGQVLKQGQSPKSQGRRLAVTGEPGAGKTTLLQKIAQWVAAETEQDVAIWVSLADLQGLTVEEYLLQKWLKDDALRVRITPEMEDALISLFNSGRVWLLLDAVDEMGATGNPLATVAAQIRGWVASARVVVTCRQNVWDAGKNALEGFDVYRNLDFDYPDGVRQFIQRWFAPHPDSGERLLAELAQAGKERIRDTVRNPLRLALLCRAWQIRQGSLPETKAGLYRQFVEALYEWKQEAFPTTEEKQEELNAALGRLALRGMEQSESRFRLKEGLVREVLGKKDQPIFSLALQLGWLNLVGVAVENPDERVYAFYHPTFQEYFAALAVDDWGYFLHHVPDNPRLGTYRIFEKQWKEVILLWFGRENLEKEKKEAFIDNLVNFDDGCGDWNYWEVDKGFYEYRAYFLAGAIVPEFKDSRLADEIVSQIFKSCVSYLYSIKTGANAVLVETDRSRAINHLIRILDETSDESTRRSAADSLGKIAVENEGAIFRLIELLDETSDESTRRMIADSLRKIALGNNGSIFRLIQLLYKTSFEYQQFAYGFGKIAVENQEHINSLLQQMDQTSDEFTRREIADILGKTASGNEQAINRLIQLLDETPDDTTRRFSVDSLGKIAVGNYGAILRLIQLLDETSNAHILRSVVDSLDKIAFGYKWVIFRLIKVIYETSSKYIHQGVADSLGNIALGNHGAIFCLTQLLNENLSESTCRGVADSLGNIAVENEAAIFWLIQLLNENSSESTCRGIVDSLGKIAVGNEGAIDQLIQLLDKTLSESTRRFAAEILGKIAVGNEKAITRLIQLSDETSSVSTRRSVADSLAKMAEGNKGAIDQLIQLLDKTSSESTRGIVAEILGKIAVGNEKAITRLIQLLDETSSESTRRSVADSFGNIAVGNEGAINRLIQLLNETSNEDTRWRVAYILNKIAEGKKGAITRLIQLLDETSDEYTRRIVADILGKIAWESERVEQRLIRLLDETSDEDTRRSVADILGKIPLRSERVKQRLIRLLDETSDEDTRRSVADILRAMEIRSSQVYCISPEPPILDEATWRRVGSLFSKIGKGNKGAIDRLIQLLDENNKLTRPIAADILNRIEIGTEEVIDRSIQLIDETSDESTQRMVADILGRIKAGHEGAIKRLIQLLDETSDESTRRVIANSLGKIAVGNEEAIFCLLQMLDKTSDENTRRSVAYILGKIIVTNEQYCRLVAVLKHNLNKNIYQNKFGLYEASYKLIWQFNQNLTYAEFYKAWNYQETPVTQLTPISTSAPKSQNNLWQKLWEQLNRPIF
jgi:HEAT repeat protein/energy-coupling factor transporter ATP-binding protein EcfA2